MKIRMPVLLITAVLAAGCGSAAAPAGSQPVTPAPAPAATTAAPVSCKQQGAKWKAAHRRAIRRFENSLKPFETGTVTSAQAHALASASQAMVNAPVPACADPKGYYGQAMANLVTAGTAASGGGALAELGAMTPMENASTLLTELSAELRQTIGSGKI